MPVDASYIAAGALNRPCPQCGGDTVRSVEYAGTFCPVCGIWTSAKCTDRTCFYCSPRPGKPTPELIAVGKAYLAAEKALEAQESRR